MATRNGEGANLMQTTERSITIIFSRVVYTLIAINILVFAADSIFRGGLSNVLALHFPQNENYVIWQYLSHMFMHGSLTHLLFNMFALLMFGTALENIFGKTRFIIFYFACGIGAAVIYNVINSYQFNEIYSILSASGLNNTDIISMIQQSSYPPKVLSEEQAREILSLYHVPMVGASGAIYGILVAYAIYFPNKKLLFIFVPFPIAAKYFVPALIAVDLFSGVTGFSLFGGGVAHFAHVGGAIIGLLLMTIWRKEFLES